MSGGGLAAEGPRVTLRPYRDDDMPLMEPWYSEAAAAVHGLADVSIHDVNHLHYQVMAAETQDNEGGLLVITRSGEDAPIGFLDYRLDVPDEGDVMIYEVALAASARRWGLGVEAVRLFEETAARRWSVRRFRADVAVQHGLREAVLVKRIVV